MDFQQRRALFWSNPQAWPGNYRGNIFIARGVHIIGMQLYGDDWREDLVSKRPLPPLPHYRLYELNPTMYLDRAGVADARALLKEAGKAVGSDVVLAQDEWNELAPIYREISKSIASGDAMWREAIANLVKGLIAGDITSSFQDLGGGEYKPITSETWIVNDPVVLLERFVSCQFVPARPFEVVPFHTDPTQHKLIFVGAESLSLFRQKLASHYDQVVRGPKIAASDLKPASPTAPQEPRSRRSPQAEKARSALVKAFPPTGHPPTSEYTDGEVVKIIQDQFGPNAPSRDTILRAAGRKSYPALKKDEHR